MANEKLKAVIELAMEAVALLDFRTGDMSTDAYLGLVEDFKRRAKAALATTPAVDPLKCAHDNTEQLTGTLFRCEDCLSVGNPDAEIWGEPTLHRIEPATEPVEHDTCWEGCPHKPPKPTEGEAVCRGHSHGNCNYFALCDSVCDTCGRLVIEDDCPSQIGDPSKPNALYHDFGEGADIELEDPLAEQVE